MQQWEHEAKAKQMIKAGKTITEIVRATDLDTTWIKLQIAKERKNAL